LTEHRLPDSNINRSAYDAMNRRTTETLFDGRTVTYSYTATGMRASATDERGSTTYAYDALDRLIGVSLPTGMTAGYAYDADGRRVESLLGSQVTHSLWDEASQYGDVILETDGDGDVLASYVLGGMNLLSQTHAGETSYFSRDALGSTRALTDASGTVTDTYSYTAFGELFAQTGSTTNRYLFTGQQYDPATGLYSMRARYYDPSIGRFLTRDTYPVNYNDPVELNRYVYVANDPVNAMDPSGQSALVDFGLRLTMAGVKGAATGALTGSLGGSFFYIAAGMGFCGQNVQDWALSLTSLERAQYLAQSAAIGAAFGGVAGIAAAISPAAAGYAGAVMGGIGLGSSVYDSITNGWNACNVLGAVLSIGGGLAGGGTTFNVEIPKFGLLLGPEGVTVWGLTTQIVPITISSGTGAITIGNVFTFSSGGGGSSKQPLQPGESGRFGDLNARRVTGDNLTPHHMPQDAAGFTSRENGGALVLPNDEHVQTRTFGARGARVNRDEVGLPFGVRLQRDIDDVRAIALRFHGNRTFYDEGIRNLLEYYRINFPQFDSRSIS
jgi:RHS repeat-associated protein